MTGTPVNDLRTFCEYDNTKLIIYIVIRRGNPGATNSNAYTETPVRGKPRDASVGDPRCPQANIHNPKNSALRLKLNFKICETLK